MGPYIRAAALTNFIEVARHLGVKPLALLREAGLSAASLGDPEQRIPLAAGVALLEAAARQARCPTFGLRMAESRQLADFGAVSLLLSHQPTLHDALKTLIEYRHLLNESLAIDIEEAGDTVILREELAGDTAAASRQAIELAIGVLFRMCGALLGANWRPESVNFTHGAPSDLQVHRRVFGSTAGCRIEFDSEFNGIVCSAADLARTNPSADPAMAKYARRFIDQLPGAQPESMALEVRKAIYLLLPMGRATIEQVAQGLGLTVRTLQRQLDEVGATFSDLLNEVRRELARRYVENGSQPLTRVAALLGYSMPSSFTRWFAAEFGTAPARWRARRAQVPGETADSTSSRKRVI